MTIGSWSTGLNFGVNFDGLNAAKQWTGADGRTIAGRVTHKSQWNTYDMTHRMSRSPDPSPITLFASDDGVNWTAFGGRVPFSSIAGNSQYEGYMTSDISGEWRTSDEYALLAKLLTKVKSHSFNVGVSLAEVDKFSSGVVSTIQTLGFGVLDLSRGDFSAFARRFGTKPPERYAWRKLSHLDVSGRFLEMRYAWQPAIADTYEAAKAFEAISNGPRQKVYKASRKRKRNIFGDASFGRIPGVRTVKRTYTYEAYEELSVWRQMGLGNPASILWERLPYSFVLDWFIPIGTYLELIGQVPYLKGRFMRTDSWQEIYAGVIQPNADGKFGGWKFLKPRPSINSVHFKMSRTIPSSLSVPRPSLQVAGAVQGKRIQNALALAHQIFTRATVKALRGSSLETQ